MTKKDAASERCYFDSDGWLQGPVNIEHHRTSNQYPGGLPHSAVQGVVMHTMVGNLPGTDSCFLNPNFGASAHFGIGQDGSVIQWVPLGSGAWHIVSGNDHWYGIEHADDGNPHNPLTAEQLKASAQIVEALSVAAEFPLQVTDSVDGQGYGEHNMGGASWGGHSCPDYPFQGNPFARSTQRAGIVETARAIRSDSPVPLPGPAPLPTSPYPVLEQGSTGTKVKELQADLNVHGDAKPALVVDGDFGPKTFAAVKQLQKVSGLKVTGIVDLPTWQALLKKGQK
jgi:hypothetical protein